MAPPACPRPTTPHPLSPFPSPAQDNSNDHSVYVMGPPLGRELWRAGLGQRPRRCAALVRLVVVVLALCVCVCVCTSVAVPANVTGHPSTTATAAAADNASNATRLLFAYFTTPSTALHLALNTNGSWLRFAALNSNNPVAPGFCRDPFINRDPADPMLFHIVMTGGWNGRDLTYQTLRLPASGSGPAMLSNTSVLPVMESVADCSCVWAPEFVYVPAERAFLLFWASQVGSLGEDKRIWARWTPDFRTFRGDPFVLFYPNFTVIDADMVTSIGPPGTYTMFFKDERGSNTPPTPDKAVRQVATASLATPVFTSPSALLTPTMTEGPEAVRAPPALAPFGQPYILYADCFESAHFSVSLSADGHAFSPAPNSSCSDPGPHVLFPEEARHGSFVPITEQEAAILQQTWP